MWPARHVRQLSRDYMYLNRASKKFDKKYFKYDEQQRKFYLNVCEPEQGQRWRLVVKHIVEKLMSKC